MEFVPKTVPTVFRIADALKKIDEPIITPESAADDLAAIADIRRLHPVPQSDFTPLPERKQ